MMHFEKKQNKTIVWAINLINCCNSQYSETSNDHNHRYIKILDKRLNKQNGQSSYLLGEYLNGCVHNL